MPTHSAPTPVLTEKKLVWQKDKAEELLRCVNSGNFKNKIATGTNSVDESMDRALREFTGSIFEVSRCMRKKCKLGKSYKGSACFDAECYQNQQKNNTCQENAFELQDIRFRGR